VLAPSYFTERGLSRRLGASIANLARGRYFAGSGSA
jgi:hypothetical protein